MPLIDMPLAELRKYTGRNPRPDDFDSFWDDSLKELDAVDPRVELTPAEFTAPGVEYFHMQFTGVGGARIYAKLARPMRRDKPGPGLVLFHGYGGQSCSWTGLSVWGMAGFTVAAMDCRGQGGRSQDVGGVVGTTLRGHIVRGLNGPTKNMLFRHVFLDAAQLARLVMQMDGVDPARVGATGGSQGGGLTLACAALEPRIKKAAPMYPFLSDYRRVWEMDRADLAYEELKQYFRNFDPTHANEEETFRTLGYIDIQYLAPRISAEVLMFTGLMDAICPPSTQFAAYNRITARKSMVIYHDFGHEGLPGADDRVFQFMMGL